MAERDRVSEILAVRERAGRGGPSPSKWDLERLTSTLEQLKSVENAGEFIPIRVVTILEVFLRSWIEKLVDFGPPYLQRAAKLKIDLKFDLSIAGDLHKGVVTLGQLIAHSVSLNRVENIGAIFDRLLEESLFHAISQARDRWEIEIKGGPDKPIIDDIEGLKRNLSRLFEIRHVLVHEMPRQKPYETEELGTLLKCAIMFVQAADEFLLTRLYGNYPLTQREMNREAAARYASASEELQNICKEIAGEYPSDRIYEVQKFWQQFVDAEAQRQSEVASGGSMQPMIYSSAAEQLTRTRIDELRRWIEEGKY